MSRCVVCLTSDQLDLLGQPSGRETNYRVAVVVLTLAQKGKGRRGDRLRLDGDDHAGGGTRGRVNSVTARGFGQVYTLVRLCYCEGDAQRA